MNPQFPVQNAPQQPINPQHQVNPVIQPVQQPLVPQPVIPQPVIQQPVVQPVVQPVIQEQPQVVVQPLVPISPIPFQMAPPAQQVAPAGQAPPENLAASAALEALGKYKDAALAGLSDDDRSLVMALSNGDPIKTLEVLQVLQSSGKLGTQLAQAPQPIQSNEQPSVSTVLPTGVLPLQYEQQPELPLVDRSRVGGAVALTPPPPQTPEEAIRRMASQLHGHTITF